MVRKRIRFAQNFFRNRELVASIVANSSINKEDVVYEIGSGRGIITNELAKQAKKVIAIEKDQALVGWLRNKFSEYDNVEILEGDFLKYKIRESKYKIFSNIPFNITADIIKGILFEKKPPKEAYLVVQKEAAQKFVGAPTETEVSILAKPWFELTILRNFRREDFEPIPSVDVILLHITKREQPLVSPDDTQDYLKFVKFGFRSWKKDLKIAYKQVFTHEQWKRLAKDLSFHPRITPSELKFEQWLGLFGYFKKGVVESKKAIVLSR